MSHIKNIPKIVSLEHAIDILKKHRIQYDHILENKDKIYFSYRSLNIAAWWIKDKILTFYL